MTTQICPISDLATAQALDSEVITLTSQLVGAMRSWSRLGMLCLMIDQQEHWKTLGYRGYDAWVMSIQERTGYQRSSLYRFKAAYLEIESHPERESISGMTEATKDLFLQLPGALQRNPAVLQTARGASRARVLREYIAEHNPEAHIEVKETVLLSFESSFMPVFHALVEQTRLAEDDPGLSYEKCIEAWGASWVQEHQN